MSADLRHHLGQLGERVAAEHLERRGYEVVARNHRTRFGELDLIAADECFLMLGAREEACSRSSERSARSEAEVESAC